MGQTRTPRIGLALSSGGARGFAHVGVLKALHEAGLTVTSVVGSSMGGVVAAGYALRGDIAEVEQWVLDFRARDHARRGWPVMDLDRLTAFFDDLLGGAWIADCLIPLTLIATDLRRRVPVRLTEGPLAVALSASTAMPFLHRPVAWDDTLLADGALTCVLPTAAARQPGIDLVIGSFASRETYRLETFLLGLTQRAGRLARGWQRTYVDFFRSLPLTAPLAEALPEPAPPTVIVAPDLTGIGALDFHKARDAIAAGERAARAKLDEIKALLGFAPDPA